MACLVNNDLFTWTLNVRNNSDIIVTGVTATLTLPPGITIVSSAPTKGNYDTMSGIWSIGTIAPSASHTIVLQAQVNDATLQPFNAVAIVAGNEFETYLINNISTSQKGGACNDECAHGFSCSDNPVSCTCGRIVVDSGVCNRGSEIEYRVLAGSEVNAVVNLDSVSGHYNVSLLDYSQPWSFDYEIYCCCDSVCTGPLTSCTISGESNIDCTTWGFVVNAGTTGDATDNSSGEVDMNVCGNDILHFWSSDNTININVTPGSAIVDITLNVDELFAIMNGLPLDCTLLNP